MKNTTHHWLMKSEPNVYSIDHLARDRTTLWEGVRNYQARNFMMNEMKVGDDVLFYHSSCDPAGIYGLATVSRIAQADPTQFNKKSDYYEPKATLEKPIWFCVEVKFKKILKNPVTLHDLKANSKLKGMQVLKRGQRLSIQPVTSAEYAEVIKMSGERS